MLWTEYRPVIKIGPKGAQGINEIRQIHSAPTLGQSIEVFKWIIQQNICKKGTITAVMCRGIINEYGY